MVLNVGIPESLHTALPFQRIEEDLPWVGLQPTTLCSLGECSTN